MTVLREEPVLEALSWGAARELAAGCARLLEPVAVPLAEAAGCRLAAPLRALVPVPGVDVAAMDGYAVAGPPPWHVVAHVLAGGTPYPATLLPGEAVEIATGAPVPAGTSAVLPYEQAGPSGDRPPEGGSSGTRPRPPEGGGSGGALWVAGHVEAGRHVRRRGEDVAEGAAVLGAGALVTPVVLGLAAALGHDTLPVRPRPRVRVLVTGDEVVGHGLPEPGRVRDAIGPFLPGLVAWAGGRLAETARLPDGPDPLRAALAPGGSPVEVVVVCGASSKGPADHLRAVLADLGAEVLVDGVAVRPGHPQLLARMPSGTLVVGLPGNPFAALAAAVTLLAPMLRTMAGREARREVSALAGTVRTHPRDTRLVPVRRSGRGAVPVGHDRPGSLWGAAMADALAVVPAGWAGEPVELIELPEGG
ncbi:molybdopterin molybdotransferase MoeA [Nonomuraea sp. SBT364]|uniref:molybdopterin molybdotransferase MoeA n=1 Tax=Nonomuraea sp. SBT364 TaxID=1580530 RepID=UPI00066A1893|nr:molybdopterin molybdotransferase MoeA [Nonomuraea sp. SBT364]